MSRNARNGDRSRNTDTSDGARRSFAYEATNELPGVGGDIITRSILNGGMTIVGWDERRECWNHPDCGISIGIRHADSSWTLINVASNADPAMVKMISDFETAGGILAGSVRIGVRPRTEGDLNAMMSDGIPRGVLPPSASDKKRKFSKAERNQGGRHAGKPQIVYKPKAMTLGGFIDLVRTIGPMIKSDWFVGESTPAMFKNGDVRVSFAPAGSTPAEVKQLARFKFFTVVETPRCNSSCALNEALSVFGDHDEEE